VKKLVFSLLVIILLVGIAGCSSQTASTTAPVVTHTNAYDQYATSEYGSTTKGGYGNDGIVVQQPPVAPTLTVMLPPATTTTIAGSTGTSAIGAAGTITERMVIRTANMALVVDDVTSSLNEITNLANSSGGYIVSSDIKENQNRLYANISFRVDSKKFSETLQALRNLAVDVRSESTSGQDVTEEYVDLDSQLHNLEASEAQLLVLMNKAGTVEEILKVQQQLTSTRGQIEQIKGRMQYLQQSTALSSIYVSLEQSKLTAEFYASSTTVNENEDIRFNPTVGGGFEPYSFTWDFGDGKTSTEGSPLHRYSNAGTYTVKLTIKDDKSKTVEATRENYMTIINNGWNAGNVAGTAVKGLVGFGHFLASMFIWLGILSPIWIVILVVLYFAVWRRRKKKA
jgi:hypothetical protein